MTLIDLAPLRSVPKLVRPISKQHPTESRRLWESVTSGLLRKEFGEATRAKHIIEQRQRDETAERKRRGVECVNFPLLSPPHLFSGGRRGVNFCVCHVLIAWSFFGLFFRFVPKYFEKDIQSGVPTLSQAGRVALEAELKYEDEVVHADANARERHNNDGSSAPSPGS
jgi:hypothetical protein